MFRAIAHRHRPPPADTAFAAVGSVLLVVGLTAVLYLASAVAPVAPAPTVPLVSSHAPPSRPAAPRLSGSGGPESRAVRDRGRPADGVRIPRLDPRLRFLIFVGAMVAVGFVPRPSSRWPALRRRARFRGGSAVRQRLSWRRG